MAGKITRRVHFYRVEALGLDASNTLHPVDLVPALAAVDKLKPKYKVPDSRYLYLDDGNELYMEISKLGPKKIKGLLATKRRSDLPPVEEAGAYTEVPLGHDGGLAEIRHFIYYRKQKLLGIEFNFYAPRISRWAKYLEAMSGGAAEQVLTEMVLTGESLEIVENNRIAAVEITVLRDRMSTIESLEDASLLQAFQGARAANPQAQKLTVTAELGTRKRDASLDPSWLKKVTRKWLGEHVGELSDLKVRAFDDRAGRTRTLNLLEDAFVAFREVQSVDSSSRRVVAASMYQQIDSAAQELQERLDGEFDEDPAEE